MIYIEYNNIYNLLNTLLNRFYCEYYKLFKIIEDYIIEINNDKLNKKLLNKNTFPVYKDIDDNINYEFTLTVEIQSTIILYINYIVDYLQNKNIELNDNTSQFKNGIHIDNIINYKKFTNNVINEKINMFVHYLEALNTQHVKYINRLYNITKSLLDNINDNIQFNDSDSHNNVEIELDPDIHIF